MTTQAIRLVESRPTDFMDSWLASLSEKTAIAYSSDLKQFWQWLGTDDVASVTRDDCQRYMAHLKREFAPASVNRKFSAVRAMLQEAYMREIIDRNPADGIKGFKASGISKRTGAPTREQVEDLLASIDDSLIGVRDRAIIYLAAGLGLRREEIADLAVDSIGESDGQVVLTIVGKGSKTRRNTLTGNTLQAVLRWIALARISRDVPLIQSIHNGRLTGRPMCPGAIYQVVRKRTGWHPHMLRAFFVTEALKNGADVYKVQRAVGHADPRTTQGYDQARDDLEDSAAQFVRI